MEERTREVLVSGIKPTGAPHLGNLVGMLRPARSAAPLHESYLFVADLHALTTTRDGPELRQFVHDGVAALLAVGVDPDRTTVFRQSDVPGILELAWMLGCLAPVPLLERAHAFKAASAAGDPPSLGLFSYPVLMASDILTLGGTIVPVGPDQLQHLEITRELARRFNHAFGASLPLPQPLRADPAVVSLPGLDGRKMSKRYGNTIPLAASPSQRRSLVGRIVTDSTPMGAPKDPENSAVMAILRAFDRSEAAQNLSEELRAGRAGWADAKETLIEVLDREVEPVRRRFVKLRADEAHLDAVLRRGGARARERSAPLLRNLRVGVGIGPGRAQSRTGEATGIEQRLDAALAMTFPASDPVALTSGESQERHEAPRLQPGAGR